MSCGSEILRRLLLAGVFCTALGGPAVAAEPATQDMIQALKPAPARGQRSQAVRHKAETGAGPVVAAAAEAAASAAEAAAAAAAETPPSMALGIQFESNSARVRPESGRLLGNLVAAMQSPELKTSRFVIEGHGEARGNTAANQRLSQDRAEEVRLYLVALGVHPARLKAVGKGPAELVSDLDPSTANRRVRVVTVE